MSTGRVPAHVSIDGVSGYINKMNSHCSNCPPSKEQLTLAMGLLASQLKVILSSSPLPPQINSAYNAQLLTVEITTYCSLIIVHIVFHYSTIVNRHSWNAHGEELYLIIRTITSHIKFRTRNVNHSPTYTLAQSVLLHHSPLWEGSSRTLTLMSL